MEVVEGPQREGASVVRRDEVGYVVVEASLVRHGSGHQLAGGHRETSEVFLDPASSHAGDPVAIISVWGRAVGVELREAGVARGVGNDRPERDAVEMPLEPAPARERQPRSPDGQGSHPEPGVGRKEHVASLDGGKLLEQRAIEHVARNRRVAKQQVRLTLRQ